MHRLFASNIILVILLAALVWVYNAHAGEIRQQLTQRIETASFVLWCQQNRQNLSPETRIRLAQMETSISTSKEIKQ